MPAIQAFLAGYQHCAKLANPTVKVLLNYANDPTFFNQAKCRQTALSQIARGSKVVFTAAGQCGLGGLDAAKRRGVWGIGVDADQYFLGRHMLTSATKKVDVSVYDTIKDYSEDEDEVQGRVRQDLLAQEQRRRLRPAEQGAAGLGTRAVHGKLEGADREDQVGQGQAPDQVSTALRVQGAGRVPAP